jgi:hypothetical protein
MTRSEVAEGQILEPSGSMLPRNCGGRPAGKELRRRASSENGDYWQAEGARGDGAGGIQAAAMWCPDGRRWEVPGVVVLRDSGSVDGGSL